MPGEPQIGSIGSQVGTLSVAVSDAGLFAVRWVSPEPLARDLGLPRRAIDDDGALVRPALSQLRDYFAGHRKVFDLALDWRLVSGRTSLAVLRTLYETVGFGESVSYGELAIRSGSGVPARGVGAIMGANPLPIVVPCHRVVAASGLGGFSGGTRASGEDADSLGPGSNVYGIETKRWLLTFEGVLPPMLGWDPNERLDLDAIRPISGGPGRGATA